MNISAKNKRSIEWFFKTATSNARKSTPSAHVQELKCMLMAEQPPVKLNYNVIIQRDAEHPGADLPSSRCPFLHTGSPQAHRSFEASHLRSMLVPYFALNLYVMSRGSRWAFRLRCQRKQIVEVRKFSWIRFGFGWLNIGRLFSGFCFRFSGGVRFFVMGWFLFVRVLVICR